MPRLSTHLLVLFLLWIFSSMSVSGQAQPNNPLSKAPWALSNAEIRRFSPSQRKKLEEWAALNSVKNLNQGNFKMALVLIKLAIRLRPNFHPYLSMAGAAALRLGKKKESLVYFKMAVIES